MCVRMYLKNNATQQCEVRSTNAALRASVWTPATHETLPVLRGGGGGGGALWAPAGPLLLVVEAEMGDYRCFF